MKPKVKEKIRLSAMAKREERWGLLFVAPPLIGFALFMAYPIIFAVIASMSKWTGMNSLWGNMVGLQNYGKILTDLKFWKSMGTTVIYMIGIPIGMILGMLIAMALFLVFLRYKKIKSSGEVMKLAIFIASTALLAYGIIFLAHISIFQTEDQYLDAYAMSLSIARYGCPFMLGGAYLLIGVKRTDLSHPMFWH